MRENIRLREKCIYWNWSGYPLWLGFSIEIVFLLPWVTLPYLPLRHHFSLLGTSCPLSLQSTDQTLAAIPSVLSLLLELHETSYTTNMKRNQLLSFVFPVCTGVQSKLKLALLCNRVPLIAFFFFNKTNSILPIIFRLHLAWRWGGWCGQKNSI